MLLLAFCVLAVSSVGEVCQVSSAQHPLFTASTAPNSWLHLAGCSITRQYLSYALVALKCQMQQSGYQATKNDACDRQPQWFVKKDRNWLSRCREMSDLGIWKCQRNILISFAWKNAIFNATVERYHFNFVKHHSDLLNRTPTLGMFEAAIHEVDDTPFNVTTVPFGVPLAYLARAVTRTREFVDFVRNTYLQWPSTRVIWKTSNEFCTDNRSGPLSFFNNVSSDAMLAAGFDVVDMYSVTGARNCVTDRSKDRWHHYEHERDIQLHIDRCLGHLNNK